MLVCGESDGGLGIEFAEDDAVDAVFVGGEVQAGVLGAVIVPLLPTEYRQREIQKTDANRAQNIRLAKRVRLQPQGPSRYLCVGDGKGCRVTT